MRPQGRRLRRGLRGCGWAVGRGGCGVRGGGGGGTGRRGGGGGGGACRGGAAEAAGPRGACRGGVGGFGGHAGGGRCGRAGSRRITCDGSRGGGGGTAGRRGRGSGPGARGRLSFTARIYVPNARQHGTAPRPSPEQIIGGHGFRKGSVHQREGDAARDAVCQSHREPFGQSDSAGRDGARRCRPHRLRLRPTQGRHALHCHARQTVRPLDGRLPCGSPRHRRAAFGCGWTAGYTD